MSPIDRREFVRGASAGFFALGLDPGRAARPRRVGPNDEIRAAVIGIRARGREHIKQLHALEGVRVVALCDVDEAVLAREAKAFADRGESVFTATDMRRIFDRDDVDVVAMATPNHWHALGTVWACQAGKDVYVEKPVSHNVWEGRQMVRAARCHGRIVQTGTQCRSSRAFVEAFDWIHAGNLGAIRVAKGFCYKARKSIGRVRGPQPLPSGIDYDLWTGPARLVPLLRKNLHYDWHWDFETGNGDLGNQGVHQVDLCLWAIGATGLPKSVQSFGGRFGYEDDGNTPNTLITICDYDEVPFVFEVRGLPPTKAAQAESWNNGSMDRYKGVGIGCVIECEDGWLELPSYSRAIARDADGAEIRRWDGAGNHFANFIDAVRSREIDDLTADIELGHVASAVCHAANASYLLGHRTDLASVRAELGESPLELEALERFSGHLAANEVDLSADEPRFGPRLELDPETERCTNMDEANWLMTRQYREPYVVPDVV